MPEMTSRQRMFRALSCQEVDHSPCCFMSFGALRQRLNEDWYEVAREEQKMGLDAMLFIPTASRQARPEHPDLRGLPIHFHPEVKSREWREHQPGEAAILHKEYITPAGRLTTSVRLSEDWPHGNHIPFIDDYQIPRQIKPLICEPADLQALEYLLMPPATEDVAAFHREAGKADAFAKTHDLLLAGGWGVSIDMANWLCGMQNLMVMMIQQPVFFADLLDLIQRWNQARMEAVLSAPVDVFFRRAWYEGCDFISPRLYRQFVLPRLKVEVDLAHEHGVKFAYICTSGINPLLDSFLDAGPDALVGIDPIQGTRTDLALIHNKLAGKICAWGGVSAAVTVEMGSEEEVRAAVRLALQTLGPQGLILSSVDNITRNIDQSWRNIAVFIDEWRRHC
jgi:uroporphyrinogen-III decarboxylase